MALVSGRSNLNPNAPLFIPAALRQVEDFSPEWWNLIKTSTWFHDYWLSENSEDDLFNGNDASDFDASNVSDLLPETFYLGAEDFLNMETQFEEFIQSSEAEGNISAFLASKGMPKDGSEIDSTAALMRNLSLTKSPKERGSRYAPNPAMYQEKPAKNITPKCSPKQIHQPR